MVGYLIVKRHMNGNPLHPQPQLYDPGKYQINSSRKDERKALHVKFYAVLGSDISNIIDYFPYSCD